MFWQKSRNVQISDNSVVKTAKILLKFLIDGKKVNQTILTINRLINRCFSQP